MSDKNYPQSDPGSSKPILTGTTLKGDPGLAGYHLVADPPFIGIPCDSDDSNPVFTNANSVFHVIAGNAVLADNDDADSWVLSVESVTNCSANTSGTFGISVTAITADTALIQVKAEKSDHPDLYAYVFVKRIHKGEQGDQGIQGVKGDTGDTGDTGPAGVNGTGLAIVKKTIDVLGTGVSATGSNYDDMLRINRTSHGYSEGDWVAIEGCGYNSRPAYITNVVDANNFDTNLDFISSGVCQLDDPENLRSLANDNYQDVVFKNLVPRGARVVEIMLIRKLETAIDIYTSCGAALTGSYTVSMHWSSFNLNDSERIAYKNVMRDSYFDKYYTQYWHAIPVIDDNSLNRSMVIRFTPTAGDDWNNELATEEYEFIVSYIQYTDLFD